MAEELSQAVREEERCRAPLEKAWLSALVRDYSIELVPHEGLDAGACADLLGQGRTVYLTAVPGRDAKIAIAAAARLRKAGLRPVPHLAARRLTSAAALAEFLTQAVNEAGVDDLLVIAGDDEQPRGPYRDSLAVLESGLFERHGIRRVGIAGYPGGHPKIAEGMLKEALLKKCAAAAHAGLEARIVSQFCFEPARITAWLGNAGIASCRLPIHVGLPGLASAAALLKFAQRCGVALSLRMLRAQGQALVSLLAASAPDETLVALARLRGAGGANPARIHFFPFGGIARTARWAEAIARGDFTLREDENGLEVRDA